MIAFASVIASPEKYAAYAAPGIRLAAEPDSVVAELTEATSMCSAYNEILDALAPRDDLEALVLLHEDTQILDPGFCSRVRARLADPEIAVIGAVGAVGVTSLRWWEGSGRGRVGETRGTVDFGGGCHPVDAVDGLMLVLSPWATRSLRFDEDRFDAFHAYDVDFCFTARAAGKQVVVDDLPVFHHTKGGYGDVEAYARADRAWQEKWRPAEQPLAAR